MDEEDIRARDAQIKARAQRVKQELPETEAVLGRMRAQAIEDLFATEPAEADKREHQYRSVQTIDAVLVALRGAIRAAEQVDLIAELTARPDTDQG